MAIIKSINFKKSEGYIIMTFGCNFNGQHLPPTQISHLEFLEMKLDHWVRLSRRGDLTVMVSIPLVEIWVSLRSWNVRPWFRIEPINFRKLKFHLDLLWPIDGPTRMHWIPMDWNDPNPWLNRPTNGCKQMSSIYKTVLLQLSIKTNPWCFQ